MTTSVALLVPILVLAVVALFAFAGCSSFAAEPSQSPPAGPGPGPGPDPDPTKQPHPDPTPPPPYQDVISNETGLRGYWRLGEAAGATTAADSKPVVAMRRPGTYKPGVTLGEPGALRLGKDATDTAAAFDGTGFVEIDTHDDVVNPPLSFSIEAWVRPAFTGAATGTIVASIEGRPERRGFALEVVQDAAGVLKAQVRVGDGGLTAPTPVQAALGPSTLDGWRHVVATYDGVTKQLQLYVTTGPTPTMSAAPGPVVYKPADTTNDPFRIGAGRDENQFSVGGVPTPPANLFVGRIDEVALYDRALDAATVADHFAKATTK